MASRSSHADPIGFAVVALLLTTLALSFGDALIKGAAGEVGLWQMFLLRSVLALPAFALLLLALAKGASLWPRAPLWVLLRVALLVAMWIAYYLSLPHLPLSVAAAAYYTLPIFITLFSAVFLDERIAPVGWLAAVLGFAGVLVVLRPGADGVNVALALPLLAAVFYALAMIVTRAKCREDHPLTIGLWLTLGFALAGGVGVAILGHTEADASGFIALGWVPLGEIDWRVMGVLAAALVIGSVGTAIAYRNAPPSILGVFDFSYVGYAVLWGVLFFKEIPGPLTLTGICMIVVAGILATRRRETG